MLKKLITLATALSLCVSAFSSEGDLSNLPASEQTGSAASSGSYTAVSTAMVVMGVLFFVGIIVVVASVKKNTT